MSVAEEPKPVARKPSANPFGDAKPVDTQTKLLELEKRQAEREKEAASQKTEESEKAVGDHCEEPEAQTPPQVEEQVAADPRGGFQHYQHQHQQQQPPRYNQFYNQRGGHYNNNRGGYQQYQQHQKHHYYEQTHANYEQGAPPGSVMIKKRESVDVEKPKEEEVPPTDPVHYPLDVARVSADL